MPRVQAQVDEEEQQHETTGPTAEAEAVQLGQQASEPQADLPESGRRPELAGFAAASATEGSHVAAGSSVHSWAAVPSEAAVVLEVGRRRKEEEEAEGAAAATGATSGILPGRALPGGSKGNSSRGGTSDIEVPE